MLLLHSSRPWIPPRIPSVNRIYSPPKRLSMPCPCWWMKSSALCVSNLLTDSKGKWEAGFQRTCCELESPTNLNVSDNLHAKDLRVDLKNAMQVQGLCAKLMIASVLSYFLLRMTQVNFMNALINRAQDILFSLAAPSLPFACMSSSLNKPTPLRLDVSLPSLQDIRWNFARLIYLFNIQLERNVATFFIVLLAACFSFVLIGGFLFFKFRGREQPLEDCLWEAWACLVSSSTHLRVH